MGCWFLISGKNPSNTLVMSARAFCWLRSLVTEGPSGSLEIYGPWVLGLENANGSLGAIGARVNLPHLTT